MKQARSSDELRDGGSPQRVQLIRLLELLAEAVARRLLSTKRSSHRETSKEGNSTITDQIDALKTTDREQ